MFDLDVLWQDYDALCQELADLNDRISDARFEEDWFTAGLLEADANRVARECHEALDAFLAAESWSYAI